MALTKIVDTNLTDTKTAVVASLSEVGFGILTEIDVANTLKNKLGVERDPLLILGACNPSLAHEALQAQPAFALMMPCNVVLEEEGKGTKISIVDPRDLIDSEELQDLATKASGLLQQALDKLA